MTKRKFALSHDDFLNCLNDGRINITSFSEPVAAQFQALSLGAFVVALKGYENNIVKKMYLVMCFQYDIKSKHFQVTVFNGS